MADIQANIGIGVDTSQALAAIRDLQRQISAFHQSMAKGGALANAESLKMQQNLINTINASGKFSAGMARITSTTESFTNSLEKNKLSMGEYFRYAGGASRTFGKLFRSEFDTINKVARERVKDLQTQYIKMGRDANGALQAIKVRPLALDMDNLGTRVQMAAQKQQLFNQLVKQGTTNLLNFGKNTQWAGRQLMVGFTIPLTIFGATAAREFQKLEEQAVKFRRVYGDMFTTSADTEKALSNIRDLAEEFTKYGVAVEKTLGLAAQVAQMGSVGPDLMAQVTQATRLAVLGGIEQEEALNTTISLTSAFGVASKDLANSIAFLNAVENQTILSIEDFNEAIPKAGAVVKQLGGDVEDLAFFLTAMREGGINASESANALKSSLASIINPTEVSKKKLAEFGIDIVGIVDKNAGNLRNTVMSLATELNALGDLDRARAIEQLFGKFQFARISTLFQNITKDGTQAQRVLDLTANSTEELAIIAERELSKVENSVAFKFQKQIETLLATLAPIGEEFIKAVTPIIEFATKILNSFNNLGDGAKQFIVILTAIGGVVAPAALMAFGLIANGVANLLKFFSFLGGAFGALSGKSTMLGGQTEYMTQQQLEAAAVAAALGQSHMQLTQIFSSEAAALRNLTAAYQSAITAQAGFRGFGGTATRPGTPGQKPKGFAKGGVVRGPGTNTSDSILAMLSDGEAIIPAKQVKKYGAVVQQLISGNIPGYAFGEVVGGPGTYRAVGPSAIMAKGNTASSPIDMSWLAQSPIAPISTASAIKTQRESATGTGYDNISAEGQAAVQFAGQKLQEHAKNTSSFVDAANQAYQDTLLYLNEQVAANKMSAQEAKEIADATRVTLAPTKEDVLAGEVAFPRQGLEERNGSIVAGKPRDERKGTSNKKRARNRLRKELESSGYGTEEAFGISEDRELSFAHVQDSIKLSQEEAEGLGLDTSPSLRGKSEKLPQELDLLQRKQAGERVPRGTPLAASTAELESLEKEAAAVGTNIVRSQIDASESEAGIGSPAKRFIEIGRNIVNSTAMGMEEQIAEQRGKPPLPGNLAAPKPPDIPTPGVSGSGFKGKLAGFGKKVGSKAEDIFFKTSAGKKVANYFAETSGGDITDSKGNVISTVGGATPVKVVDEVTFDPALQNAIETGTIESENLSEKMVQQKDSTETLAQSQEDRAKQDDAALKEEKRQNRQARAGKALGLLGTATMVAGMATQVEGVVGETAQGILGPLAAFSGIAPILMALPVPLALLLAVVGGVAFGFYKLNEHLQKTREEARTLAENLGSGTKAMERFANFAGTVSATEIMQKQRQLPGINILPGKSEFGQNFIADEAGKEFVSSIKAGLDSIGKSDTAKKIGNQLGTAIAGGVLTADQARGIALEVGREIGDFGFTIEVNGILNELIGPDGENILENPISLAVDLVEGSAEDIVGPGGTFELLKQQLDGTLGDSWLGSLTDLAGREAQLAGELVAFTEQRQSVLDSFDVATTKRVEELRAEANQLRENGKLEEANAKVAEARAFEATRATERAGVVSETAAPLSGMFEEIDKMSSVLEGTMYEASSGWWNRTLTFMQRNPLTGDLVGGAISDEVKEADKFMRSMSQTVNQMGEAAKERFAGTEIEGSINRTIDAITKQEVPIKTQMVFTSAIASGAMSSGFAMDFLESFDPTKEEDQKVYSVITDLVFKYGEGAVTQVETILSSLKDVYGEDMDKKKTLETEILTVIGNAADSQKALDFFNLLAVYDDSVSSVAIQFYMENPEAIDEVTSKLNEVQDYLDANGVMTIETLVEQKFLTDQQAANMSKENAEFFEGLDPVQQFLYMQTFLTVFETIGEDQAGAWLTSQGESRQGTTGLGMGQRPSFTEEQLARGRTGAAVQQTEQFVQSTTSALADFGNELENTDAAGGSSPGLDSLITKLRDLRLATIDLKKGWEGMQQVLESVFAGGTKGINVFEGLSNQIRRMGVGENLIEMIVGMDPDEYNKRKNELFVFDKAGNIVDTTSKLKNMQSAFNAIAIGDYVNQQQRFIENTKNQISAISILTANGMSLAEAYQVVQDEALAAAIAMGATKAEIDEIIRITGLVRQNREEMERQQERSRISESVRKTNEEFRNQVAVLRQLSKEQGKYSDAQIQAIMGDSDLQKLFLDPSIDPKALQEALRNAEQKANLEVQIAIAQGNEIEPFEKFMSEVSDYFSKAEAVINVDFEVATADDNDIITDAENQIADIQYKLDDYNAELEQISWIEDDINEKYDKRSEALDEIAKTNDRIAKQQQAQLNIADALSRGDIASAARAVSELRSQQAEDAQQTQKDMLDKAREAELAAVTGPSGMTREQLEEAITQLERQIFTLEEQMLEPAQERIRLAEIARDLAIEQLELNDMTRQTFEQIAAATRLADLDMENMVLSAEKLVALSEFIRTGERGANWEELFPSITATASSGGGGGGGGGAPSAAAPAPSNAPSPQTSVASSLKNDARSLDAQIAAANKKASTQIVGQKEIQQKAALVAAKSWTLKALHATTGKTNYKASGGMIIPKRMAMGGKVMKYAAGGLSMGSDIVPAMLTPGEFVVRRPAVSAFGADNLEKINSGTYSDGSVYNYNLAVNVKSDADPNKIARTVMTQIKSIESQRIRGSNI